MKIDLHSHTTASDGKLSPKELIDFAIKNKVPAMAITDHDNVYGLDEAISYANLKRFELVSGVEFSANPSDLAKEIHIVGLYIDHNHKKIERMVEAQRKFGIIHSKKIIQRLNELGYEINYDEVAYTAGKDNFGRPTIAQVLMKKYPEFTDRKQVFNELLGKDGKAFIKSESSSIEDIVEVTHRAGGKAILAHPGYLFNNAIKVIDEFVRCGGDGIEVDCPYTSFGDEAKNLREKFRKIAKEKNLLISGGTDYHGLKDDSIVGSYGITKREFDILKESLGKK